jgi:hypothetical protein
MWQVTVSVEYNGIVLFDPCVVREELGSVRKGTNLFKRFTTTDEGDRVLARGLFVPVLAIDDAGYEAHLRLANEPSRVRDEHVLHTNDTFALRVAGLSGDCGSRVADVVAWRRREQPDRVPGGEVRRVCSGLLVSRPLDGRLRVHLLPSPPTPKGHGFNRVLGCAFFDSMSHDQHDDGRPVGARAPMSKPAGGRSLIFWSPIPAPRLPDREAPRIDLVVWIGRVGVPEGEAVVARHHALADGGLLQRHTRLVSTKKDSTCRPMKAPPAWKDDVRRSEVHPLPPRQLLQRPGFDGEAGARGRSCIPIDDVGPGLDEEDVGMVPQGVPVLALPSGGLDPLRRVYDGCSRGRDNRRLVRSIGRRPPARPTHDAVEGGRRGGWGSAAPLPPRSEAYLTRSPRLYLRLRGRPGRSDSLGARLGLVRRAAATRK